MWPLNYYFFNEWHLKNMFEGGNLGMFMLFFRIAMIFIISYSNLFLWKALVLFLGLWLWRFGRNGDVIIDIYPVRQTHPGKLNDG
jgi:hypothetical protein